MPIAVVLLQVLFMQIYLYSCIFSILWIFSTQVLHEYLVLLSLTLCAECTYALPANCLSLTHSQSQLCVSLSSEFCIWWYEVTHCKSSMVRSFSPHKSANEAINVSFGIRDNYLTFTSMPLFSRTFMFSMWPLKPNHSLLNFIKYLCFLFFSLKTQIFSLKKSLCFPCHLFLTTSQSPFR